MIKINDQEFEELVNNVWEQIPQEFKDQIENTVLVIEEEPKKEQLQRLKVKGLLLGLFEGIPKIAWGQSYSTTIPNKITIFRNPILSASKDPKDLKITIHVVVMHEIAHYLGYNDNDMFVMDKKMRARLSKDNLDHE